MEDVSCDTNLKFRMKTCFQIINKYSWLLDSYVLDFFTENHMQKLQNSWKDNLEHIPLEGFHYLMNFSENKQSYVWPLSIICLRALLQYLTLPRKINNSFSDNISKGNCGKKSFLLEHPNLKHLFTKHVKPKKRYEIVKMAETTAELANKLQVNYVIDIGSGLGHLSRLMAYGFNLNVCSIETQQQLLKQAEKLDIELENVACKNVDHEGINSIKARRPVHLNQTIESNLSVDDFIRTVKSFFSVNSFDFKFGIVGLHPCGDLASTLLRLYVNCPEAVFITLVGCCYHKLSTSSDGAKIVGFPLTSFCAKECPTISYEARSLACHAIETYSSRLKSSNYDDLKVHCYRAALEKIIEKNWPQHRKSVLGSVKIKPGVEFNEYCELALKKLNVTVPIEDLISNETVQNLLKWESVVKFYSLRLMLAPLIETVILLDRKIFLAEKGIRSRIIPAFDPEISPRNHLLISEKVSGFIVGAF